jgi:poly(3-hydroxybutyrate) depolymerase
MNMMQYGRIVPSNRKLAIAVFLVLFVMVISGGGPKAEEATTLPYQGLVRSYVLHLAPNQTEPRPLVMALHGLGESVEDLRGSWTFDAVADREGFDVVYPKALNGRWAYVDTRPVKLPDGQSLVDDVGFLGGLLDKLLADHVADPARVYVVGVSNGALMAWTLACIMPNRLAGVAPLISGMVERQAEQCHPTRLAPLLVLAGTDDLTQDYDGAMGESYRLMSVPETLEFSNEPSTAPEHPQPPQPSQSNRTMPNPCRICTNPEWAEQTRIWVTAGVADREIGRRLGIDKSSVMRHRKNHVIAPLQHQLAIAGKGAAPRQAHALLAAAAASDAPIPAQFVEAFFGLKAQAEKLQRIEARLERVAVLAEESASPNAVAQVAAQQLRSVEVGARVAGVAGYGSGRATDQAGGGAPRFSVNIVFSAANRTETISIGPATSTSDSRGEHDPRASLNAEFTQAANAVEAEFTTTDATGLDAAVSDLDHDTRDPGVDYDC